MRYSHAPRGPPSPGRSSPKERAMIILPLASILPLLASPPPVLDARAAPACLGPQKEGPKDILAGVDLYPPQRSKTRLLFFSLDGDIRADPIRHALSELST